MFPVEIRVDYHAALTARMTSMREWLDHRRFEPATMFRYSSGLRGFVVRVEFSVESEANAFAAQFGGRLHSGDGDGYTRSRDIDYVLKMLPMRAPISSIVMIRHHSDSMRVADFTTFYKKFTCHK